ncbi:uncharacterized protein N7479_003249 [Penicillium vulpinum]|uniref:Uncharacterized protein n=1 Tax=Penicillium vulpinum TaxID=29845 RepID=A0A1V6S3Q4_9EURO|nr:uncharacterized protein N7479_003249 [Penicillium vulpinum]KAJ5963373.1 hypothetical protein N7479_003249 [Penicillium vulpinum]OQE08687.1 hypothetical protein PENVUL_c009G09652 [Penicillium vulpinum]
MACPPRETFQIGWICALPIEAAAAKEMLDESFGILDVQDLADTNTYSLGRIGKHYVAIACLPGGQYGTTSATMVANNMVRTFSKSLRIGLMVGVAGGTPSAAHDIRLGDVVISYPTGTCGGVVQYDMGKVGLNGEFDRTGSLNSPPRSLLAAVGTMRAAELTDNPLFPEYLSRAIGRNDRTRKNLGRPETQQDRFFKCDYDHPITASSCDVCPVECEETRSERQSRDPQLHYGIIASGNSVIKHGRTREKLRLSTGALCFEMEAAGLMQDFPCIVIRGICDYADSHKNKQWQGYAALAAASYAKELLGYIPMGCVAQESLAADTCNELKHEVQGTNKRLDRVYNQQEQYRREKVTRALTDQQHRCHRAFKISNYEEQMNINPIRAQGTCQWVFQSFEYIRWRESYSNDLLWISADPGCGKSVLARSIIDNHLRTSRPIVTICYFFFKDNDEQNHLSAALCSVLHQLFSQRPHLLDHAILPWEKNGDRLQQEVDELWRVFTTATSADLSNKTICIFDTLDECREIDQDRLIEKLRLFRRQPCSSTQGTCLKFLVTSRPYNQIQNRFREITESFPHLHLKGEDKNDQIHEEINLVVKIQVKELADTALLSINTQQRLEEQLLQMKHRTYLWLYLAIDDIRSTLENSLRPDEESIRMIPSSVSKAYEKIIDRVPLGQIKTARMILQIIVGARRPLTLAEMAMALGIAIRPQSQTTAQAGLCPLQIETKLRRLCGLFVFINNSKIYLIHETAREFLIQKATLNNIDSIYPFSLGETDDLMANICLRYLLMDDLEDEEDKLSSDTRSLLRYSALYWPDHVREMASTSDKELTDRVHRLYDITGKRFFLWFPILWKAARPYMRVPTMSALQLAAFNGHEKEAHLLLCQDKGNINTADDTGTYPLMYASIYGYDKVVQVLLEQGADVNAEGGHYRNALQAACSSGYDNIAQMLLKWGANVNAQHDLYGNALKAACSGGHNNIAQMLLEWGADVNAEGGRYGNALHAACSSGHDSIVQTLLECGADVNAEGGRYRNALQAACSSGHDNIAQMLLKWGANVNVQDNRYGNALQAACFGGHDNIVQMLLERGANVNAQGGRYGNALQAARSGGHDRIAQMLLDWGAFVKVQEDGYDYAPRAAEHSASPLGSIGTLITTHVPQVLREREFDVNAFYIV